MTSYGKGKRKQTLKNNGGTSTSPPCSIAEGRRRGKSDFIREGQKETDTEGKGWEQLFICTLDVLIIVSLDRQGNISLAAIFSH